MSVNNKLTASPFSCAVRQQPYFSQETAMSSLAKVPLTVAGAEALRAELHRLKTIERPNVVVAISEARAQGDLSENAEYDAAKERQGFVEGRIIELESKLSSAQVIDPKALEDDGRVVFGVTVDLEAVETGEQVSYQIVGEDEADIKLGKVSFSSRHDRKIGWRHGGSSRAGWCRRV
jgi:transcription elongation factor GreA